MIGLEHPGKTVVLPARARRIVLLTLLAAIGSLSSSSTAVAEHITGTRDHAGVRNQLGPTQGYLSYHLQAPFGEERTGWTDVRHPANDGSTFVDPNSGQQLKDLKDTSLGYDRSDFFVDVNNKIVTIDRAPGTPGGGTETANPNIPRDYDFANQIWAQAGISVLNTGVQNVDHSTGNAAGNNVVQSPVNIGPPFPDDQDMIQAQNRQASPVVNNWYATSGVDSNGGVLRGITTPPTSATDGTMIFDNAANDTFAHELGHYLLDGYEFTNPGDTAHSPLANDLMASGSLPRNLPTAAQKGQGNTAPSDPGRPNGANLGKVDHLDANVRLNGMGAAVGQIQAVQESAFVQRNPHPTNALLFGDRADFDWVEDNFNLERAGGNADNHPGAFDDMIWKIGPTAGSAHPGHDHGNWLGGNEPELTLGGFTQDNFRLVDVVSQIARYTDMDIDAAGNWSPRESALDYLLEFSQNATDWVAGVATDVFIEGWTARSTADNFVARWQSPVDAQYVRIRADPLDGHDGNAQIDAIIAAQLERDFGDAPDSFHTLLASDGPRYQEGGLQRLGNLWDWEPDGQPTTFAIGDDISTLDDEDGVSFGDGYVDLALSILRPGVNNYLLRGWGDFDFNGMFDHTQEMFIDNLLTLSPGEYHFRFARPNVNTYYRFRLTWMDDPSGWLETSTGLITSDVKPWGEYVSLNDGLSHGEVEDYHVPEPSALALWSVLGLVGAGGHSCCRRRR